MRTAFYDNYEVYAELEIMNEVCRGLNPHLLPILESFDREDPFFVSKYMTQGDLYKFSFDLRRNPLTPQQT